MSSQCQNPDYSYHNLNNKKHLKKKKNRNYATVSQETVLAAYQNFMSNMRNKGYEINIYEARFLALATNPQTVEFDSKSLFEIEGGLHLEA